MNDQEEKNEEEDKEEYTTFKKIFSGIQAIIFDLDGVLIECKRIINNLLSIYKVNEEEKAIFNNCRYGDPYSILFKKLKEKGLEYDRENFNLQLAKCSDDITKDSQIISILNFLSDKGIKLIVLSSRDEISLKEILKRTEIYNYIDFYFSSYEEKKRQKFQKFCIY